MGIKLRANPRFQLLDNNGAPANGWKIHTYEPGTVINKATFTDNARTGTNTNPIILNARGEADIWWSGSYKVVVKDANDVTIYTVDNYGAGEEVAVSGSYNLLANGSFELDDDGNSLPDDWTITEYDATSTVVIDTGDPNHGTNCLKFVSTGLGGGYAESALIEVSGAEDLFVGFAVKSSVVDVRNRVEIKWYDKDQLLLSTSGVWDESAANPTAYTAYKYTATSHASAKYARMVIYGCHNSDATAGETRFDNMKVVAITGDMMLQDADSVAITGGNITGLTTMEATSIFSTPPTTAGTGAAYTATAGESAYVTGRVYAVNPHTDNTGAATINLDAIGIKTIKNRHGSALTAGQMQANVEVRLIYDGTDMLLLNEAIVTNDNMTAGTISGNRIVANDISQSEVGSSAVGQGELKTTTWTGSGTGTNLIVTSGGGAYAFRPMWRNSQASTTALYFGSPLTTVTGTTYQTKYELDMSSGTGYAQERYVQASPPYNLGDGDIPLFIFGMVDNATGEITGLYTAPEAPWHYNGKTDIRATRKDKVSGRSWRKCCRAQFEKNEHGVDIKVLLSDPLTRQQGLDILADKTSYEFEVTQDIKQADMGDIPHPFEGNDLTGKTIIMLDPVSTVTEQLLTLLDSGENINEVIHDGLITFGNTQIDRVTPSGVMCVSLDWKKTR